MKKIKVESSLEYYDCDDCGLYSSGELVITVNDDTYTADHDGHMGYGSWDGETGLNYWCHILAAVVGQGVCVNINGERWDDEVVTPQWLPVDQYNNYKGDYCHIDVASETQTLIINKYITYRCQTEHQYDIDEDTGENYGLTNEDELVEVLVKCYLESIGYEIV